jgi:hypothetical protein
MSDSVRVPDAKTVANGYHHALPSHLDSRNPSINLRFRTVSVSLILGLSVACAASALGEPTTAVHVMARRRMR